MKAGRIQSKQSPVINSQDAFTFIFRKVEAVPETPEQPDPPASPIFINGAKFVVLRKDNQYLAYRNPPMRGGFLLPYFTPDRAEAHEFVSSSYLSLDGLVFIPGLPRYLPDNETEAEYRLLVIAAAPGYVLPDEAEQENNDSLKFSYQNKVVPDQTEQPRHIENRRIPSTIIVQKYGDPEVIGWNSQAPYWMKYPAGARFVLAKIENPAQNPPQIRLFAGYGDDDAAVFTEDFNPSDYRGGANSVEELWENILAAFPSTQVLETQEFSGSLAFSGLPHGEYAVVEITLPPGYERTTEVFRDEQGNIQEYNESIFITLDVENTNAKADVYNRLIPNTFIARKTDMSRSKSLPGAEFVVMVNKIRRAHPWGSEEGFLKEPIQAGQAPILTTTGELPHRFVSDENGLVVISNLLQEDADYGYSYSLHEVKAPEGYLLPGGTDYSFSFPIYPYNPGQMYSEFYSIPNLGGLQIPFSLKARKVLKYGTLEAGQFTFDLYQRTEGQEDKLLATTTNDANGDIWFRDMWLKHQGEETTQLVVKERVPAPADRGPIIYDEAKECIQNVAFVTPPREDIGGGSSIQPMLNGETTLSAAAIALQFLGGLIYIKDGVEVPCVFVNEVILDPGRPPGPAGVGR